MSLISPAWIWVPLLLSGSGLHSLPASQPQTNLNSLQWKDTAGTRVPVPPQEHPRLYLRAPQVAQLPARLQDPILKPVWDQLRSQARRSPQMQVEWDALQFLLNRDNTSGRATITSALELLRECELPNQQDACRVTGRMMVTGAVVYDWLYELLTPAEKRAFIAELVRLAKTQECGYPPTGQGSVTGHASEAMIMRDMISAGIAIYDEFPEMYELAAGRFFREHLPARNWFYNGHAYHQGDSYGAHRYSWDTYPLWIFDRLGAGNVYNPEQRFVPYLWIYSTRPDGQRLRAGDTFAHSTPRGRPWSEYLGTILTASYYGDGFLLDQFLRHGGSSGSQLIFEALWRDTNLQPKPVASLPHSRYFGYPFGWMIARTGWDEKSMIVEMKINEVNFVNHQHLDAGAFQIYYRGALAIDSGLYSGSSGAYGSPHCRNYYWRTIAHNSLLVFDPGETFKPGYANDGGQRLPNGRNEPRTLAALQATENSYRTGRVLAHGFGPDPNSPDYTLLEGDLTAAYSEKVRKVTRSFVFLNLRHPQVPGALIVLDRVISSNPAFQKLWLAHSLEEPEIHESSATLDATAHGAQGRLTLDVLLPTRQNLAFSKVGGTGKEFWVFGTNYENSLEPARLARGSMEPGAWRLEVAPKNPAAEDTFLNVMQVTSREDPVRFTVQKFQAGPWIGSLVTGPEYSCLVLFGPETRSTAEIQFTVPGTNPCRVLVTSLAPGAWRASSSISAKSIDLTVSARSGAAWFQVQPGSCTLRRLGQQ